MTKSDWENTIVLIDTLPITVGVSVCIQTAGIGHQWSTYTIITTASSAKSTYAEGSLSLWWPLCKIHAVNAMVCDTRVRWLFVTMLLLYCWRYWRPCQIYICAVIFITLCYHNNRSQYIYVRQASNYCHTQWFISTNNPDHCNITTNFRYLYKCPSWMF